MLPFYTYLTMKNKLANTFVCICEFVNIVFKLPVNLIIRILIVN